MDFDYFVDSEAAMNFDSKELDEVFDEIEMIEHCEIIENSQLFDSEYDDQLYDICVMAEKTDSQSLRPLLCTSSTLCPVQIGLGNMVKSSIESEDGNKDVKRARVDEPFTSTDTDTDRMFNNTSKTKGFKKGTSNKKWITNEELKKLFPEGYRKCDFFSSPVEFLAMSKEACLNWKPTALIDLNKKIDLPKNLQEAFYIGHSSDTELFTNLLNINNKKTETPHNNSSINHKENIPYCNTVASHSKELLEVQSNNEVDKFSIKSLPHYILNNKDISITYTSGSNISKTRCDKFKNESDSEREKILYAPNNIQLIPLDYRIGVTDRAAGQAIQDESTFDENCEYYKNVLKYFHLDSISDIFQNLHDHSAP